MDYFRQIILFTLLAVGLAADNTFDPLILARSNEEPHQRPTFYNWDGRDLGTTAFENLPHQTSQSTPLPINQSEHCPDGWLKFFDSCYFFETEALGFAKAEKNCQDKQATLFVANSLDEWETVRAHTKKSQFSWIGLVRFSQYERYEKLPRWQTTGSINPSKINWLINPYQPLGNGWSTVANCVALFEFPSTIESSSYAFFYPCTQHFNSICERNSTILNARN
ncbi:hypothetical protein CAEBREN_01228 [Caenorhabditis brenneri]|uniref:C-type lectin domain-containing protein n=1 Tax=Caenorhabditis brenneri TaxID=135651 RepID=G0PCA6_CAEBE|nr:hypothetical protein CAEBREN_01228 [Caenorhabditis brenneri]